ncbi:MAG TPA: hypothetical protein O0X97_00305 [Methanocorpusculum sp.]|nr:hypothetical protein [Methanocorpusculum sp.]
MIELTEDKVRNKFRKALDRTKESPSTDYAERHAHLVELYLEYLVKNYPPEEQNKNLRAEDAKPAEECA